MRRATTRRDLLGAAGSLAAGMALPGRAWAQLLDTSRYRVVTNLDVPLPYLGSVRPRGTDEITGSNWLIGCETLDRDFADYDQYKTYLAPLGIKRLRMQAGWAKTEKQAGTYDFAWLDHIVGDATARGLQPWLQTSYGNPIYPGGGGDNLGGGLPVSPAALAAYDRWVTALVTRYRDKVDNWEVWNEPNFGDNTMNSPEATADFNARTARIVRRLQPRAKISGLALGHYDGTFVERFFKRLREARAVDLFDTITYHNYVYNPDSDMAEVRALRSIVARYSSRLRLRQGENGAPSAGGAGRGALWDYPWTEVSQAKWDIRRMLANLGMDVESSVFSIVDMAYTNGPIHRLNYKGLLKSDMTRRVVRPKLAYYAVQNVTAIFDDTLERIASLRGTFDIASVGPADHAYHHSTDHRLAVFGYRHRGSGRHLYPIWQSDGIPTDGSATSAQVITLANADIVDPVWVDILTGAVHAIQAAQWRREGTRLTFTGIPVYDSPIVLADRSLVPLSTAD